jgi:hypothetical protein
MHPEETDIGPAGAPERLPRHAAENPAARTANRVYGSILAVVMGGAELAWLCALAYLVYWLIS